MSYISATDQKTLVPDRVMTELTDDDADGIADQDIIATVILEACETVDGFLRGRYSLPFAKTPTIISSIAKQIARYKLYERRPEGFELPKTVSDGNTNALKMLLQIQNGVMTLGVPEGELLAGQQVPDDGEFHVHVRPSRDRQSTFSKSLLDQY